MTDKCPTADRIRGLVDGSLSDAEADAVQLHIESCPVCQAAIQDLSAGGSFWESVGRHLATEPPSGPELERVMEQLRQQSPEDAEQTGEAIELKLSFIEPPVEPGTIGRLQHYDILRVAGRGGMGIVVKAFDRSLRRVVAIKLLAPHLAGNGQARQRFVREGRAAAGICHEHVITIHAVEEHPPYLVMQFVQGETLEARIHRNGALDIRETVRIAKQIAQGLAAAHAQGVVHRDIKPANILLENGVARVRITDFGLARAVDDASLTQSGVIAGTPQYMAPEQASGDAVDERADLFSLGSVIYTMLAGHAPFRATTAMGVLKRLCDHSARPIREINPDVPDWLMLIVNRLHAKRPADRFQSAEEVAALLERGLASLQHGLAPTVEIQTVKSPSGQAVETAVRAESSDSEAVMASSERSESGSVQLIPNWLLNPIPLWILLIPIGLFLLVFLGNIRSESDREALFGITIAAIALGLGWRWMSRPSSREHVRGAVSDSEWPITRAGRFLSRVREVAPRSWHHGMLWLAAWVSPVVVWAIVFFEEESWAIYGDPESLADRDRDMWITAAGVCVLWSLIAIAWFRRKRPDGSRLFPERRVPRVVFTLLLAAIFCSCGLWIWFSDVHYLVQIWGDRIRTDFPPDQIAEDAAPRKHHLLKLEFESPLKGTAIVIELPDNERYRFTSEQSGVAMTGVGSRSGTFPWRAYVGQTEFASGEVTLQPNEIAEINVPQPRLDQLIAGRWRTVPEPNAGGFGMSPGLAPDLADNKPAVWLELDSRRLLLVTYESQSNAPADEPLRIRRDDFSIEIDDSVEPALINLLSNDGRRIAGIMRFLPGEAATGSDMGMAGGGEPMIGGMGRGMGGFGGSPGLGQEAADMADMYGGGMESLYAGSPDVLEICTNNGSGLRPWEFKTNEQTGQMLLRLQRGHAQQSLREEMAYQPVQTSAAPQQATESVTAWAGKLKVEPEGTNSLGMELVLVPPAEFKQMIPALPVVTLPTIEPDTAGDNTPRPADEALDDDSFSGGPGAAFGQPYSTMGPAQIAVTYPFVMTRRPVSIEHFRKFIEATGYVTDAERGTEASGQPSAPGGWQRASDDFTFLKGVNWHLKMGVGGFVEVADSSLPVTQVSWRDATGFCQWLSETERRQYRLPTAHEWAAAMQLGVPQLRPVPPVAGEVNDSGVWNSFDAGVEHVLKLQTPESLFAEWTETRSTPEFRQLARRSLSPDGSRFGWSPQYSASQTFRADTIGFRVVAELQALGGSSAAAVQTEQP